MARQLHQLAAVQEGFAARIQQKVSDKRDTVQEHAEDIPLVGWLLKPLAGFVFDLEESANTWKGEHGEKTVLEGLLRALPNSWVLFHNVVVEPRPDDFAQIDLLAIGPAGLFLIETKAWRGSFKASRDQWHVRTGSHWRTVASPTTQVQRQARKLKLWLEYHGLPTPQPANTWIVATVVFTQAQWLGVNACSVRVFDGQRALHSFLQTQPEGVLTSIQINQLCDLIVRSPAPPTQTRQPQETAMRPSPAQPIQPMPAEILPAAAPLATPICPKCNVPMVLRTARRGANSGQQFYGCRNYPTCREMQQYSQHQPATNAAPVTMPIAQPVQPSSPVEGATSPVVSFTYRCGACQAEVGRNAKFCHACGSKL